MTTWTGKTFARIRERLPTLMRNPAELFLAKNSVLHTTGWLRSRNEMLPVNAEGKPIPWIAYPAIRFLEPRIRQSFKVFEFGSGFSTHWWAQRVSSIRSVEHDQEWVDRVSPSLPANATLLFAQGDAYVESVSGQFYDIIVNDGIRRPDCGKSSISALSPGGIVIWDDTDEMGDQDGHLFMRDAGFKRLDFWGFAPLMVRERCTSVFYRADNCLGI